MQLLDRKVKKLRNKQILLVKILWRNHGVEEPTWEVEEEMQKKYPELFINQCENFENEILIRGRKCDDPKFILYFILFYFFEYIFLTLLYCLNFLVIFIRESRFLILP